MKTLFAFVATVTLFSTLALAETWTGTLVDNMCKDKPDLASHTKKCALNCAKSGFGLVTGGKFVKFDSAGNAKAVTALKASSKEKDLQATVTGTLQDDTIQVESIQIQ